MMNTCTHMQRLLQQKYIVMSSGKRKTKTFTNVKKKCLDILFSNTKLRIHIITGTVAATFPTSSSVCMIFFMRACNK